MSRFFPYEIRISLPQHHVKPYNDGFLLQGTWDLPTHRKTIKEADPYKLAYKVWLRIAEFKKLRGSLMLSDIQLFPYLRRKPFDTYTYDYTHADLYNACYAMKPAYAYNPHKFREVPQSAEVSLTDAESSPLIDLCTYAQDQGIHVALRYYALSENLCATFWKGVHNLSIFPTDQGFQMWTPHGGLKAHFSEGEVFRQGISELRSFVG